jgi:predicted permease
VNWFWFHRKDRDDDLERELRSDLELEAEELAERGVSPDEAAYAARRSFGNATLVKEDVRNAWGGVWLENLAKDVRYALRDLRKSRAFAVTAVLSLAVGIGANTAIFSVVDGILLRPLPYPDPDRLVRVWESEPSKGFSRNVVNPLNFLDWRDRNHSFTQMAAIDGGNSNLTGAGDPVAVPAMQVSPEFFSILGIPAYLGRTFIPEEGTPGHSNSVILSYSFWQSRFGGDRNVLGKIISADGFPNIIAGVMPRGFSFPNIEADIWTPFAITRSKEFETGRYLGVIARLKPGVAVEEAQEDMARVAGQLARERPNYDQGWTAEVIPFLQDATTKVRLPLLVLLIAVGFVLLVACANLANLLLMRGTRRLPELAIRSALGAGKRRLIQQLLVEALVLALLGWALGMVVANAGVKELLAGSALNPG